MNTVNSPLSPLQFYKCLADDTRLKSLLLLLFRKELCVCDLMSALKLSQPKVSRHLADLRNCGLVEDERRGKWVYYRISPNLPAWALKILRETLKEHRNDYLSAVLENLAGTTAGTGTPACC